VGWGFAVVDGSRHVGAGRTLKRRKHGVEADVPKKGAGGAGGEGLTPDGAKDAAMASLETNAGAILRGRDLSTISSVSQAALALGALAAAAAPLADTVASAQTLLDPAEDTAPSAPSATASPPGGAGGALNLPSLHRNESFPWRPRCSACI
jgi:hypothetical protein